MYIYIYKYLGFLWDTQDLPDREGHPPMPPSFLRGDVGTCMLNKKVLHTATADKGMKSVRVGASIRAFVHPVCGCLPACMCLGAYVHVCVCMFVMACLPSASRAFACRPAASSSSAPFLPACPASLLCPPPCAPDAASPARHCSCQKRNEVSAYAKLVASKTPPHPHT